MKIFATAVLLGVILGNPALALSCRKPDIVWTYDRAAAASETYAIFKGSIVVDEGHRQPAPRKKKCKQAMTYRPGFRVICFPVRGSIS